MPSTSPSPKLTKSTALAKVQTMTARLQALVPTLTTSLSPTTVYQPGVPAVSWGTGVSGIANVLLEGGGNNQVAYVTTAGVWVAPDANGDGSAYQVQVECFGAGGGGGGGSSTEGGAGGGGGEYACEPAYNIVPGSSYVWAIANVSSGGSPVSGASGPGNDGNSTVFDLLGVSLPGGVVANGGQGGDQGSTGTAGTGGTGSGNTIHADGGLGGAGTSATGGAGGGASGGAGGTGGTGHPGSGASGGTGGIAPTGSASIFNTTTDGSQGGSGSSAGSSAGTNSNFNGSGGGGCGSTTPSGQGTTIPVAFLSAATYNGTDANGGTAAGALYNPNQQGTNSVMFTGAGPNDYATGAKNAMMLIDPALYTALGFSPPTINPIEYTVANWVTDVSLTVFNANPSNPDPVVLEIGFSYDTSLPGSYTGSTIVSSMGSLVIPPGAATATVSLTQSQVFLDSLTGFDFPSRPSAIILGPGASPAFEAFGQATSPAFNCQVYGPGAVAADGSSLAPFLTVSYRPYNGAINTGAPGAPGTVVISYVSSQGTPVAGINAFPTTDSGGSQWAQGFTGPASAWNPEAVALGTYEPEPWHQLPAASYGSGWAASGHGVNGFYWRELPDGDVELAWDIVTTSTTPGSLCTLPAQYVPAMSAVTGTGWSGTGPASYSATFSPSLSVTLGTGAVNGGALGGISGLRLFGNYRYALPNLLATAVNG